MASAPKTPRPKPEFDLHAALGEKLPAPEVIEHSSDSVWALWSEVNKQHENRFADTAPASTLHRSSEDPGWAQTQPMTVPVTLKKRAAEAQPLFTLDAAMLVARKNNRVCPRQERWQEMHALLPARKTVRGEQPPPTPPVGPAWAITAPLTKRLLFREHVEWAESQGVLENVMRFMQQMPETDWLHMGED
ncbi:hypothetical protein HHL11_21900 [Ramlibacter sp. G-1-2-2]|uniref:Uncharacterized protein n=1 Tax=Ramlibacter agri TaxID=2728837 RepID=A0A848H6K8_9BURK|nr:hypothetical protein [Ramlibacter agri]NML46415.1 hypothetical protein [Ramlibacter agri]